MRAKHSDQLDRAFVQLEEALTRLDIVRAAVRQLVNEDGEEARCVFTDDEAYAPPSAPPTVRVH